MKDNVVYITHIVECIERIESYVGEGKDTFLNDHKTYDAVLRQLQIMSESTKRLSSEVKEKYPEIEWREIAGFRNILVHDYLGELDNTIVWSVIEGRLPSLKIAMQSELKK